MSIFTTEKLEPMKNLKTITDRANSIISQAADSSDLVLMKQLFSDLATEYSRLRMEYLFEFGIKAIHDHDIEMKIHVEVQKRLRNMELSEFDNIRGKNYSQLPMNVIHRK